MSQLVSSSASVTNCTPFRNLLRFPDRWRYIAWTLLGRHGTLRCRLRSGPTLSTSSQAELRPGNFVRDLPVTCIRHGARAGRCPSHCRCGRKCRLFPFVLVLELPIRARPYLEPHPVHCELIRWHLQANGYSDRVTLLQAGATGKDSNGVLVDDDIRSKIVKEGDSNPRNRPLLEIRAVDFFETVGIEPIDILKIDIEGGEYELLQDPRFDQVAGRSRCILMEWHKRAPHHLGGDWCQQRLVNLGFAVRILRASSTKDIGMLTGTK